MKVIFNAVLLSILTLSTLAVADNLHSKYKGQEQRAIKSLSESDISELKKGGGWGLAKAAELNGVPGPAHILEMAEQINLSEQQKAEIQKLFNQMNANAKALGKTLVELESKLNKGFADKTIDQEKLIRYVHEIENIRAKLRIAHLSTHLKTPKILTAHQITIYNKLRGYGNANPCLNIPEGHDAEMWKKHNGCS